MNFLFVKLSQNCHQYVSKDVSMEVAPRNLGKPTFEGPTPPGYNLASNRIAISCRTWERYLARTSLASGIEEGIQSG
jgi:hypothetical protein